jgi:hypothetical protein
MLFADPNANAVAYLVLRHLYDGDVIDWPLDEDDPHAPLLAALEQQGLVARWDRMWPLHDRYRLTESGIAAIEAVYRPAGAEEIFEGMRQANLPPPERRGYLQSRGLDASLWPILHDPTTHWTTWGSSAPRYQSYVWEDLLAPRRRRTRTDVSRMVNDDDDVNRMRQAQMLIDLDRDEPRPLVSPQHDYDLS